uniref:HAT C-terminal dimerisation domain-containing protein n=1 Tax=Oryzias latipes TaxID=8090 RepID=A0A3P9LLJ5_ORYLA
MEKFLKRKNEVQSYRRSIVSLTGDAKCALKASYLVARRVAQSKKAFTIAEELVLPAAVDMCREMIDEAAAKKLKTIPLSNDIVSHCIADMASDIEQQLLGRIRKSPFFSLQLDELTDVTNVSLLLVFVRYRWDSSLQEDILFCGELPTRATAEECFRCMDNYFTENGLDWQNCVGVRCLILRDGCHWHGTDHVQLLYHSEVRWLSRGLVKEVFELRKEVFSFLTDRKSPLAHHYTNATFIAKLAYLSDIFSLLNQLNISLQGRNSNIFFVADKVQAFQRKLSLWSKRAHEERLDMFPLLSDILESSPQVKISHSVSQHLSQLAEKFAEYFPEDPREGHMWVVDPFSVYPTENDVALPSHLESQLLEVSTDSTLKGQWGKLDLGSVWIVVSKEYPLLALRAVKVLPFTTTYLCESGFSTVATTKTKACSRLRASLEATLRVSLSPIPPRLDLIMSKRQAQVSH